MLQQINIQGPKERNCSGGYSYYRGDGVQSAAEKLESTSTSTMCPVHQLYIAHTVHTSFSFHHIPV